MRLNQLSLAAGLIALAMLLPAASVAIGQDDVADIPSQDVKIKGDPNQRYFLLGPKKETSAPKEGHSLVVILPGGDGSADFAPFVKRIYQHATGDDYLAAQPVAVKWTDDQQVVWPTAKNRIVKMKFSTESFVAAVIDDVGKRHKLNPQRIFTLSWSSSGPAAYAISLDGKSAVTGSLIAMSVFHSDLLGPLDRAKRHGYYLYHSKEDQVCRYRFAEQARDALSKAGGKVELVTYAGGHGWTGDVFGDIRRGIEWLEKNHGPARAEPSAPKRKRKG
jgi:predicted esterase